MDGSHSAGRLAGVLWHCLLPLQPTRTTLPLSTAVSSSSHYLAPVKVGQPDRASEAHVDQLFHGRPRLDVVGLVVSTEVTIISQWNHCILRVVGRAIAILPK